MVLNRYPDCDVPPSRCPLCPGERTERQVICEDGILLEEEWYCSFCGIRISWTREECGWDEPRGD